MRQAIEWRNVYELVVLESQPLERRGECLIFDGVDAIRLEIEQRERWHVTEACGYDLQLIVRGNELLQ